LHFVARLLGVANFRRGRRAGESTWIDFKNYSR
jgi:hypothetical protein